MASGLVELVGTQIGSTGVVGHEITKLIDGDLTTYAEGTTPDNVWWGWDAGVAVVWRRWKVCPRFGDASITTQLQYENRIAGAQFQVSSDPTFATDVTTLDTVPAYATAPIQGLRVTERSLTTVGAKRYARVLFAAGTYGHVAELRAVVEAGPASAKPVQPVISPWGGQYPTGNPTVTLTSGTTSALIYYTTDGSTPDATKTLYAGPFTLTLASVAVTPKVIAIDASLGTPSSDVTTATFRPWGFKPNEDVHDDYGDLATDTISGGWLYARGGSLKNVDGYYYRYGVQANHYIHGPTYDPGVYDGLYAYKYHTSDLHNPIRVGMIVPVPPGVTWIIRSQGIYNESTRKYVLWAQVPFADCYANWTADTPIGPWTLNSAAVDPDSLGSSGDFGLFQDTDGAAYLACSNRTHGVTVYALSSDYLSTTGSHRFATGATADSVIPIKDHTGVWNLFVGALNDTDPNSTFDLRVCHAATPLGVYTTPQSATAFDPLGTDYNSQLNSIAKCPNGWLAFNDRWAYYPNLKNSRNVAVPVDDVWYQPYDAGFTAPIGWDLRRIATVPANDLLLNLVACYPLNEIGAAADAVDVVGGLTLTATNTPTYQGARIRARSFSTSGSGISYFSRASSPALQAGDISIWWNVWINLAVNNDYAGVFVKDGGAGSREYGLYINKDDSRRATFYVSRDGTAMTSVASVTYGAVVPTFPRSWVMLTCWHDADADQIGLTVTAQNGATYTRATNTASHVGGIAAGSAAFSVGNAAPFGATSNLWGRIRQVGIWKAAPPTSEQIDALWNQGASLPYESFARSATGGHFSTLFAGAVR